jgi:molecular chaperone DnaK
MPSFVGIDLGTTNTSIAVFDGKRVEVKKSIGGAHGQSETTPSAIFIDENGTQIIGSDAYRQIAYRPEDVARAWKRLLGTNSEITFKSSGLKKSPEWCSSELLKKVFGYLPANVRQDPKTSVVITVPAAFGQVKNEATLKAAEAAGIANVKLMPEPVAACLAVMHKDKSDKTFLVYDLGGGTFDVSVASFKKGTGSIIASGGIESAGGRDWDFEIVNKVIIPWICDNYEMTVDDLNDQKIKNALAQIAEQAKIELSARYEQEFDEAVSVLISLPTGDIKIEGKRLSDKGGREIGLNIPFTKAKMDQLVGPYIENTIQATKALLDRSSLSAKNIDSVVFIGGPTLFAPLRKKVVAELEIEQFAQELDPMTAVAKGAAIYAESLDWSKSGAPGKQKRTANLSADAKFPLALEFEQRVTAAKAKLVLTLDAPRFESVSVEVRNAAFTSGQMNITFSKEISLTLAEDGPNVFDVIVSAPGVAEPMTKQLTITRSVEFAGMVAPRSMFIAVWDDTLGRAIAEYVIHSGEGIPKTGTFKARANKELKHGSKEAFNLRIYEGAIVDRVEDNTFIGQLTLEGGVLDKGDIIKQGDELICDFILDDGLSLKLAVNVPSIGNVFHLSFSPDNVNPAEDWEDIAEKARDLKRRIEHFVQNKPNAELEFLIGEIQDAIGIIETSLVVEEVQSAAQRVKQAGEKFWLVRKESIPDGLLEKWENTVNYFKNMFEGRVQASATAAEKKKFEQESAKAKEAAEKGDTQTYNKHDEGMWDVIRDVIWRSGWWIEHQLNRMAREGSATEAEAAEKGQKAMKDGDQDQGRAILAKLFRTKNSSKSTKAQDIIQKF